MGQNGSFWSTCNVISRNIQLSRAEIVQSYCQAFKTVLLLYERRRRAVPTCMSNEYEV